MTLDIRTYHEMGDGGSDLARQVAAQQERVEESLAGIRSVVAVMSGKGGVGKSLLTAILATGMAREGRVAALDADLNGPSLARMLRCPEGPLRVTERGVEPAAGTGGVAVMSMALLLEGDAALRWREPEEAGFVWRGVQERGAIREFLAHVSWGARDVLLVDLPPGTQRLADLHEMVPDLAGVLVVTIPSAASCDAVARSLDLCRARSLPVLGLVENLAGYRCASCGDVGPLFEGRAGEELAAAFDVPLLARVPLDPGLARAADAGALDAWWEADGPTVAEVTRLATRLRVGLGGPGAGRRTPMEDEA